MSLLSLFNLVEAIHSQPLVHVKYLNITFYIQLAQAAQVKCVGGIASTLSL
jgi:hypothetical protein